MAFWSWSINDILVLLTWIVFVGVVFSSVFMYIIKPSPRKNSSVYDAMAEARSILPKSSKSDIGVRNGANPQSSTGPTANDEESESASLLRQQSSNRDPAREQNRGTITSAQNPARSTQGLPNTPSSGRGVPGAMNAPFEQSSTDRALIENLKSVLNLGMSIKMHTAEGPRQIQLSLVGSDLRWKSTKLLSRKTYKLSLHDVICLEKGKNTNVLRLAAASTIDEDHCLSIVTATHTLDLEAATKVERDVLVEGLSKLLQTMKTQSKV